MSKRGLTLVELMLALGVASISVLLIFEMITAGLAHYRKLDIISTTQSLTEAKMEEVVATNVTDLAASSGDFPAPHADYHYDVQVQPHGPPEVQNVTVTVTHSGGTSRTLATMRAPDKTPAGMRLFFKFDCHTCHAVTGYSAPSGSPQAPDLTTVYTKGVDYIGTSVKDPNFYVVPGWDIDGESPMTGSIPTITNEEADLMAQWLYSLGP